MAKQTPAKKTAAKVKANRKKIGREIIQEKASNMRDIFKPSVFRLGKGISDVTKNKGGSSTAVMEHKEYYKKKGTPAKKQAARHKAEVKYIERKQIAKKAKAATKATKTAMKKEGKMDAIKKGKARGEKAGKAVNRTVKKVGTKILREAASAANPKTVSQFLARTRVSDMQKGKKQRQARKK